LLSSRQQQQQQQQQQQHASAASAACSCQPHHPWTTLEFLEQPNFTEHNASDPVLTLRASTLPRLHAPYITGVLLTPVSSGDGEVPVTWTCPLQASGGGVAVEELASEWEVRFSSSHTRPCHNFTPSAGLHHHQEQCRRWSALSISNPWACCARGYGIGCNWKLVLWSCERRGVRQVQVKVLVCDTDSPFDFLNQFS
jgi:hypothetical protein